MKEYLIEYFLQGSSDLRRERVSARNEAQAQSYLKQDKGSNIIIRNTRLA